MIANPEIVRLLDFSPINPNIESVYVEKNRNNFVETARKKLKENYTLFTSTRIISWFKTLVSP